eukprot:CAMPEP_0196726832 /NCGR_PEP_ID=MMETSP1091-20130531/7977_1 /TAXON_ID=302021 /ORGANISM="Rhodomonas sp., Strain CCMP768" /LENGTH=197 /DNA_ID=CAMNT_0042069321 /DNA_START=25 /DNA_END=618 /DNA_ORIENTATION=+
MRLASAGALRSLLAVVAVGLVMGVAFFSGARERPISLEAHKWKAYTPPSNAFDDFDVGFHQAAWKTYEPENNAFDNLEGLAELNHKWKEYEKPNNVFDSMPTDRYPFDETKGGHDWKEWTGKTASEALEEPNVFDHGQGLAAIEIGEHSNGKPYKPYEAEKNVYEGLHAEDEEHKWGKSAGSIPDKNVFDHIQFPDY